MEVKYCPQCGTSIPENSKFCLSCGSNLSAIAFHPTTSTVESQSKSVVSSNVTDFEIAAARNKSYTGIAVFIFFLYFFFYFPGLAANSFFYREAKKMEEKAGMKLPGVNLLAGMMAINSIAVIITILVLLYIFGIFPFN